MSGLAPAVISRLAKICGLFSSSHTGERAAAAFRADQIVRAAGLTWPDIIGVTADSRRLGCQAAGHMTPAT